MNSYKFINNNANLRGNKNIPKSPTFRYSKILEARKKKKKVCFQFEH